MSPLDPAQDPDRFDPSRPDEPTGSLDPALDPDRYQDQTLPELLGAGAQEDDRDWLQSLLGLAGVLIFLALVTAALYLL
ncbi:MAG: hypothetical protein JWO22_68 [Frankiales bacterium]|nr:hypothetical protein [Frankiales bacterium]